jgi:hypothetical protein
MDLTPLRAHIKTAEGERDVAADELQGRPADRRTRTRLPLMV